MPEMSTVDLAASGIDTACTSTPAAEETINPSLLPTTPFSRPLSLSNASSSISPQIDGPPVDKQMAIHGMQEKAKSRTVFLCGCMDSVFTQEEMANSNYDGSRQKRKLDEKKTSFSRFCTPNFFSFSFVSVK